MARYLISFPGTAMDVSEKDLPDVAGAAHAVVQQAKDAGVYVFSGGLREDVEPVMVQPDGTVTDGTYPETGQLSGGFMVVDVPSRQAALGWAAKIAAACRCGQEVREFMLDPLA